MSAPVRIHITSDGEIANPYIRFDCTEYIRADLCPKQELAGDMFVSTEPDGSRWVQHEDALKMEAEINALKAEVEKFKSLNNRHAKALNENDVEVDRANATVDVLMAELAALKAPPKVLRAEEVVEPGYYWWSEFDDESFDIIYVGIFTKDEIDFLGFEPSDIDPVEPIHGKFIGPIQMPEV